MNSLEVVITVWLPFKPFILLMGRIYIISKSTQLSLVIDQCEGYMGAI